VDGDNDNDSMSSDEILDDVLDVTKGSERHLSASDRPCPLCEASSDDAWHAFFECTAAHLRAARLHLWAMAPDVVKAIIGLRKLTKDLPPARVTALKALDRASGGDFDTPDWRATLFRLLCGLPWPARVVDAQAAPVSRLLGELFDAVAVQPQRLRKVAKVVVHFAASHTRRTAAARRLALQDCGLIPARLPAAAVDVGAFPAGALVTVALHPPTTYIRFKLARQVTCWDCGGAGAPLIPCAQCDLVVHPFGICGALPRALPPGAEWLCQGCVVPMARFATLLGDAIPIPV
jgi:hypothetical protein